MNPFPAESAILKRARLSRDSRFDGHFFVGVKTTGIYCRPICPVRLPKESNVIYFPTAAAAQQGGFRPCLRCRPEVAPGSPAWRGSSALVSRALRLISEGALDSEGADAFAERLGVSGRHLRRLFNVHLGASPAAVARTRRVHFAKQLIDETDLPMTEVALAAGFGSLRRFNSIMRSIYGRSPSRLRDAGQEKRGTASKEGLELRLSYRRPFDWKALLQFLALRMLPGIEEVALDAGLYRRTIEPAGVAGYIEVENDVPAGCLVLRIHHSDTRRLHLIVERVRRLFDLPADPQEIRSHLSGCNILAPSLERAPGLRLPGAWDPFETAVRAVLGQQISVVGATTLAGRLVREFGRSVPGMPGTLSHLFPTPEVLARNDCRSIGLPSSRARTVSELALAVLERRVSLESSSNDLRNQLLTVPGIGDWTADYIVMRALGDPDAFPATDLGIRKALDPDRRLKSDEILEIAEDWRPWRAYAVLHLWNLIS